MTPTRTKPRLDGLDVARFLAFVGMVIVNFRIVMGAEGGDHWLARAVTLLEGRAAATFVVLAGIGLGLAAVRGNLHRTASVTVKRAGFLLVLGLANMLVFDADILHYYALYFLIGVWLLPAKTSLLLATIMLIVVSGVAMMLLMDYETGWNWNDYSYEGFWTAAGFIRNLFFNGWHPVIPWLAFLLYGIVLGRLPLGERSTQLRMIAGGTLAVTLAETASRFLQPVLASIHPDLVYFATTGPIPPTPIYVLSGIGTATAVAGLCLWSADLLGRSGVLGIVTRAGRQTLTLYVAHILIGMGTLEALGLLGGQSVQSAMLASTVFCMASIAYAFLWSRAFRYGPIESLMRRLAG